MRSPRSAIPTTTCRCSNVPRSHSRWRPGPRSRRRAPSAWSARRAAASPTRYRCSWDRPLKPRDASRRKTAPKKATARRVAARSVRGTVVGIAALLVASGIAYAGYREAGDPRFALGTIAVEGQLHTSASAVRAAAGIAPHTNVWLLDAGAAQRRIESLPWVASASVIRGWPNTITVDIVERTPVAAVALPDGGNAE